MANPSKCHSPLVEQSSHREEVEEVDEEVCINPANQA